MLMAIEAGGLGPGLQSYEMQLLHKGFDREFPPLAASKKLDFAVLPKAAQNSVADPPHLADRPGFALAVVVAWAFLPSKPKVPPSNSQELRATAQSVERRSASPVSLQRWASGCIIGWMECGFGCARWGGWREERGQLPERRCSDVLESFWACLAV